MRASLPRRLFLAMLLALAIILLIPTPLLADSAMPWVFGIGPVLLVGLIPVIFIEGLVLRRRLGLEWGRALGVTAVANIVSTVVGIAGALIVLLPMPYRGGAPLYLGLLLWLVPLFFLSWLVEYPIARWMLSPMSRRPTHLLRGMFEANLVSVTVLLILWRIAYLTPIPPALVEAGLPVFMVAIPTIGAEGLVLDLRLKLGWAGALPLSVVAKLASVFLLTTATFTLGVDIWEIAWPRFLIALVGCIFVSWLVEYAVARSVLRPERAGIAVPFRTPAPAVPKPGSSTAVPRPRPSPRRGMFDANVASYVFLAMVVGFFWVEGTFNRQGGARQSSAVGWLRMINTAEITYASTYNRGYSPTLAALGPAVGFPTAEAAGLIPSDLAAGVHSGYRFTYSSGPPDANGRIQTYTVSARPLSPKGKQGETNSYFTDQSGVIRQTTEDRPATATDSAIGG